MNTKVNEQFSQTDESGSKLLHADNFQQTIRSDYHEINTSDGCEFLSDIIRMEDMQLGNTDLLVSNE